MPGWDNFQAFLRKIEQASQGNLPGQDAQFKLVPPGRDKPNLDLIESQNPKRAGVLALFYPVEDQPHVVLMKRNTYPGVHSGQISFPGGRLEPEDADLTETALRETEEEIGVDRSSIRVLGLLSKVFIPPSNFLVQPVMGFLDHRPEFVPHDHEVDELLELPMSSFTNPQNLRATRVDVRGFKVDVPAFHINGNIIWGATAMMMSEITHMVGNK